MVFDQIRSRLGSTSPTIVGDTADILAVLTRQVLSDVVSCRAVVRLRKRIWKMPDLRVCCNFEELEDIQEEWDKFIESINGEIYLTYDWCRVWWKYYGKGRELQIFIFRNSNGICGVLPVFREKIWLGPFYINAVKIVGTDFTPITVTLPIEKDSMADIIQTFIDQLAQKWPWDVLHIGPICGRYQSFDDLVCAIGKSAVYKSDAKINPRDVQTYFSVANTWEEQVGNLVKSEQKNVKKKYHRLLERGIPVESVIATEQNLVQVFDEFVRIHQSYWQKFGQPGHFASWPLSYEFHKEVSGAQLKKARLRLHEILVDNKCIGISYRYKYGDTYYCYLYSREDSIKVDFKLIEFAECVKHAQGENIKYLDSMRGIYDYKLRMGGQLLQVKNVFVSPNKYSALIRVACFRTFASVLDICYSKLWRRRIGPRLKIKMGAFSRIWLRTNMLSYL